MGDGESENQNSNKKGLEKGNRLTWNLELEIEEAESRRRELTVRDGVVWIFHGCEAEEKPSIELRFKPLKIGTEKCKSANAIGHTPVSHFFNWGATRVNIGPKIMGYD